MKQRVVDGQAGDSQIRRNNGMFLEIEVGLVGAALALALLVPNLGSRYL